MINLLPRLFSPRELVTKSGSLMRLKYIKDSSITVLFGSQSLKSNGYLQKIEDYLNANNSVKIISCGGIKPVLSSIRILSEKLDSDRPDIIICVGGGSVLDIGKAVNFILNNKDYLITENNSAIMLPEELPKSKLIAIPTTLGSGSEASNSAVMLDSDNSYKFPLVCHSFLPEITILDPKLTSSLSDILLISTVMDALTHSIESYCSRLANPFSKEYAKLAGTIIFSVLDNLLMEPENLEHRLRLQHAAYFAGLSQNLASVGATHAVTHAAEVHLGVGHGLSNAIFLPKVIKLNAQESDSPDSYAKSIGAVSHSNLCDWINRKLHDYEIFQFSEKYFNWGDKDVARLLIDTAINDVCMKTNPINISDEKLISLFMAPM